MSGAGELAEHMTAAAGESRPVRWHALTSEAATARLEVDPATGLTPAEVAARQERVGRNVLLAVGRVPWWRVLGRQFVDVLILILFVAAGVSLAIGHAVDAATILGIILLNGLLGFIQEWRAERALAALQGMLAPRCRVLRAGVRAEIDAAELVPGDIVILATGNRVPADLRLLSSLNLRADESALTGESGAVSKDTEASPVEAIMTERQSMVWMGTTVSSGRAEGLVVATGMASGFGEIARLTQRVEREVTPLERKLAGLGVRLGLLAVGVSLLVALLGVMRGRDLVEMVLTGISLAVAVVPEGLPAVVTITLALGVRSMARKNALVRRLQATETLGAATVICTDKTGTLTRSEMTVQQIWTRAASFSVSGVGYEPTGDIQEAGRVVDAASHPALQALLIAGLRCNHARVQEVAGQWQVIGEPTEGALVVAARKAGIELEARPPLAEFPFDSTRKRMTVIDQGADGCQAHVKGAPEVILERTTHILDGETVRPITAEDREVATERQEALAAEGLRTLALAHRPLTDLEGDADLVECELVLLGLVGMLDPPRPEAAAAVALAGSAGIRTIMITGDAPTTALAIAGRIGLAATTAITGTELEAMDDAELQAALDASAVFARTTPAHKLRIVEQLQRSGEVVGMTGDGVNDAPALQKADIGIAMGIRGTDVAQSAADMILTDDNFASIINAVEEGRREYENIKKFVRYLLSSNTGEVLAILANLLLGGPLILLPVQILWMNLVTDGLTALALGVEPAGRDLMRRPPQKPGDAILDKRGMVLVLALGAYIALIALVLFYRYLDGGDPRGALVAQTVAFTAIIVAEKLNVLNFRSLSAPLTSIGLFTNPWLLVALVGTIGLQACALYVPFLQTALHTVPLSLADWGIILVVALPIFLVPESWKWVRARSQTQDRRP